MIKRRLLSFALCACLMCTAGTALAEETEGNEIYNYDASTSGVVTYTGGTDAGNFDTPYGTEITVVSADSSNIQKNHVYSVEIVWGDMAFAWGKEYASVKTWNPVEHTWDTDSEATDSLTNTWYMVNAAEGLDNDGAIELGLTTQDSVLVFNHSSQPVDVTIEVNDVEDTAGADGENLIAEFKKTSEYDVPSVEGSSVTWMLAAGTTEDVYADDGSSVMGTVSIIGAGKDPVSNDETNETEPTTNIVAKLSVTISKGTLNSTTAQS